MRFFKLYPIVYTAEQIISLIPDSLLDRFTLQTNVDTSVKKLQTKIKFMDELESSVMHEWAGEIRTVFSGKNRLNLASAQGL